MAAARSADCRIGLHRIKAARLARRAAPRVVASLRAAARPSSSGGSGCRGRACRFAADAVAQYQERQPEEPERVISAELAVGDVDIEFLFGTRHPQCRQLT